MSSPTTRAPTTMAALPTTTTTTKSKQRQVRVVTFGPQITIQEYPIILGDNPSCSGCPITIGWEVLQTYHRNLEVVEYTREEAAHAGCRRSLYQSSTGMSMSLTTGSDHSQGNKGSRRNLRKQLKLPIHKRSRLLLEAGYTKEEIIARALEVEEIKQQRAESLASSVPIIMKRNHNNSNQQPLQGIAKFISKNIKLLSKNHGGGRGDGTNTHNQNAVVNKSPSFSSLFSKSPSLTSLSQRLSLSSLRGSNHNKNKNKIGTSSTQHNHNNNTHNAVFQLKSSLSVPSSLVSSRSLSFNNNNNNKNRNRNQNKNKNNTSSRNNDNTHNAVFTTTTTTTTSTVLEQHHKQQLQQHQHQQQHQQSQSQSQSHSQFETTTTKSMMKRTNQSLNSKATTAAKKDTTHQIIPRVSQYLSLTAAAAAAAAPFATTTTTTAATTTIIEKNKILSPLLHNTVEGMTTSTVKTKSRKNHNTTSSSNSSSSTSSSTSSTTSCHQSPNNETSKQDTLAAAAAAIVKIARTA